MDNFDLNNFDPSTFDPASVSTEDIEKLNKYLEDCTGDCSSCGKADCGDRVTPRIARAAYAVFSGKGGTGKSVVTALLACALQRRGLKVGIIDADIASPAIPHLFGVSGNMPNDGEHFTPLETSSGVAIASMGVTPNESDEPNLLSGKNHADIAAYFWMGGNWNMPDCVLIDMPSGLGDIPLNVYTVLPLDGALLVTNPGKYCAKFARKSMNLVKMLMLPVLGVVENMSSGEGDSLEELHDPRLKLLAKVDYDPDIASAADEGKISEVRNPAINALADSLAEQIKAMSTK